MKFLFPLLAAYVAFAAYASFRATSAPAPAVEAHREAHRETHREAGQEANR